MYIAFGVPETQRKVIIEMEGIMSQPAVNDSLAALLQVTHDERDVAIHIKNLRSSA